MSLKLSLTYSNNIDWKSQTQMKNTIVPANSFPTNNYTGIQGQARPLKHWRKQLIPNQKVGFSKSVMHNFDTPGNTINIQYNTDDCENCDANKTSSYLKQYIPKMSPYSDPQYPSPTANESFFDASLNKWVCVACNPETHVIKTASTIVNKNYYTDTNGYLKSRCRTYDQKLPSAKYNSTANEANLDPEFLMLNCYSEKCPNQKTIYKPNNSQFVQEGAVDSSSRIAKLKYDTITKNGHSFQTASGLAGANAGRYMGTPEAPYFIKSKYTGLVCHRRPGNHTKCFKSSIKSNVPRSMNPTKDCLCLA